MISVTGEPGGRGVRAGVSIADITAGMYAAFGILAALHARQTTGRGQFIDVSMLEGQLGHSLRRDRRLSRRRHRAAAARHRLRRAAALPDVPDQDARHRDRHRQRQAVAHVLSAARPAAARRRPALRDQRGAQRQSRRRSSRRCRTRFSTKTYEEWEAILLPAGIPIGAINTIDAVVAHPQVAARGALVECDASGCRARSACRRRRCGCRRRRAPCARRRRCSASTPTTSCMRIWGSTTTRSRRCGVPASSVRGDDANAALSASSRSRARASRERRQRPRALQPI